MAQGKKIMAVLIIVLCVLALVLQGMADLMDSWSIILCAGAMIGK